MHTGTDPDVSTDRNWTSSDRGLVENPVTLSLQELVAAESGRACGQALRDGLDDPDKRGMGCHSV